MQGLAQASSRSLVLQKYRVIAIRPEGDKVMRMNAANGKE
jgi:hypothetical protein